MKLFSLSTLLLLLVFSQPAFAQKAIEDEQTLVDVAKKKAAKKRAFRQAYFAKHPEHYNAERESTLMDKYEQQSILSAKHKYQKLQKRPHEINKNDIRISYGYLTITDIGSVLLYGTHDKLGPPTPLGTISFDYKFFISNRLSIGFGAASEFLKGDIQGDYTYRGYWNGGHYNMSVKTFAPELCFILLARKKMLFYTSFAFGYSKTKKQFYFTRENYNAALQNGVRLPSGESSSSINGYGGAGIRYGGIIGGFVEAGLGFKGLFNCGLSVKL